MSTRTIGEAVDALAEDRESRQRMEAFTQTQASKVLMGLSKGLITMWDGLGIGGFDDLTAVMQGATIGFVLAMRHPEFAASLYIDLHREVPPNGPDENPDGMVGEMVDALVTVLTGREERKSE